MATAKARTTGTEELKAKPPSHEQMNGNKINLLSFDADDSGNADAMNALYGDMFIFSPAYGWLKWVDTHWKQITDAGVKKLIIATLRRRRIAAVKGSYKDDANVGKLEAIVKATKGNTSRIDGCLSVFKSYVTCEDVNEFDSSPDEINCLNGVVNLRTGSLMQHHSCQRFTYCLPIEYNSDADMSLWVDFIHEALNENEPVVHFFQKCMGYSITGYTNEERFFYVHGPAGAGKGTMIETICSLIIKPLSATPDFNTFTAKRDHSDQGFDLAPLKPARIVFASESNRYQSLNPAKVKQFTGGDDIWCCFKGKDHFSYKPQYTIWLISNHELNADPGDEALWLRPYVFTFPHAYRGTEHEDTKLKQRLKEPVNLEGLLRWLVEGAMRWYKEGLRDVPDDVIRDTKAHREHQDFVLQWWEEKPDLTIVTGRDSSVTRTLFDDGDWESSADLTKSYTAWCKENNHTPVHPHVFSDSLKRIGLVPKKQGHSKTRGYVLPQKADAADAADAENPVKAPHVKNPHSDPESGVPGVRRPQDFDEQPQQNEYTCIRCGNHSYNDDGDLRMCSGCGYAVVVTSRK